MYIERGKGIGLGEQIYYNSFKQGFTVQQSKDWSTFTLSKPQVNDLQDIIMQRKIVQYIRYQLYSKNQDIQFYSRFNSEYYI